MNNLVVKIKVERSNFLLDVDLSIPLQGVTVIFGHSGSGKTTLLRCIAGLEKSVGDVVVGDTVWQQSHSFHPVWQRDLAYVFQESSLFEHLTARGNIEYALKRMKERPSSEEMEEVTGLLGISQLLDRYPDELSGGERQRVAIARSVLKKPGLLLMDEPLASLDQARKREILPYLESLKREFHIPILYVTHSLEEFSRLGDHAVIMEDGKVSATGNVIELLGKSCLPFNHQQEPGVIIEGTVDSHDDKWSLTSIDFCDGVLWLRKLDYEKGSKVRVRILSKDVSITTSQPENTSVLNILRCEVETISTDEFDGLVNVRVKTGATRLLSRMSSKSASKLGLVSKKEVWALVKTGAIL